METKEVKKEYEIVNVLESQYYLDAVDEFENEKHLTSFDSMEELDDHYIGWEFWIDCDYVCDNNEETRLAFVTDNESRQIIFRDSSDIINEEYAIEAYFNNDSSKLEEVEIEIEWEGTIRPVAKDIDKIDFLIKYRGWEWYWYHFQWYNLIK